MQRNWDNISMNCYSSDAYYFGQGVAVGFNVVMFIWFLVRTLGWCRDPLAESIQKKLDASEADNECLRHEVNALTSALDDQADKITDLNNVLDNLRDVLRINQEIESDNETVS